MIIKTIRVQNFRSIRDETLHCDDLTALVGPNGSGKSSLLRALDLFYAPSPQYSEEDFYGGSTDSPIEIAVTFTALSQSERERFQKYVEGGDLTVIRVLSAEGGKAAAKYHGSSLQNPGFREVREAGAARDITAKYSEIRTRPEYSNLPSARSKEAVLSALAEWEAAHLDQCERARDDGQFFGFQEVAQGYLGESTRYIFIPAVRDAADDATEGRDSPITRIMDLVVRSVLANRAELQQLRKDTQGRYDEIVDPSKVTELATLAAPPSRRPQTASAFACLRPSKAVVSYIEAVRLPLMPQICRHVGGPQFQLYKRVLMEAFRMRELESEGQVGAVSTRLDLDYDAMMRMASRLDVMPPLKHLETPLK